MSSIKYVKQPPLPAPLALKMVTSMHAETSQQYQHMMQLNPQMRYFLHLFILAGHKFTTFLLYVTILYSLIVPSSLLDVT